MPENALWNENIGSRPSINISPTARAVRGLQDHGSGMGLRLRRRIECLRCEWPFASCSNLRRHFEVDGNAGGLQLVGASESPPPCYEESHANGKDDKRYYRSADDGPYRRLG